MNEADYDKDLNWDEEIPLQRNPTIEGESIAGTLCALFRADDYDFGVALIANSSHALEQWKSGTKTFYRWRSTAPPRLFVESSGKYGGRRTIGATPPTGTKTTFTHAHGIWARRH